ncbi:hypothetical protein HRI_003711200 [Hibiscus trionum]|uniref:Uncharacterized protein n=1 Tax=Hibiscus trionum TaxID=183268 RepID=A0A9W7IQR5_HIBTR|nr:hypothetical protein HRI_003711200 [Hibiscus trionum]
MLPLSYSLAQTKLNQSKTNLPSLSSSMADVDSCTKQQHLLKEKHQENPSKYYTRFLYKALLVLIFSVGIQVFPSQAPEFINQTLLNRNWELLHLLFVGIAVSYGLFSRRNDETEKDIYTNQSRFDNVQALMSRFLQVSSVFDDEAENLSGSDDCKAQTWRSIYYRNEPPVIVAKDHSVLGEDTSCCPGNPEKPLLLPVRSLKSRALNQTGRGNRANSSSLRRSNSSLSSRRFSSKGTNGEAWVEKWSENNNVVLPSPIPWRSRSGRVEMKEDNEFGSIGSKSNRLSRSKSMSSSSPKLSYSPKKSLSPFLSMEAEAKSAEDFVRKKSIHRSPPPPPPPPPMIQKPSSLKPVSSSTRNEVSFDEEGTKGKSRKAGEVQTGRINGKAVRFDHQTSSLAEKLNRESIGFRRKPKPTFMELAEEEKRDIVEKVMVETTDDDSESDGGGESETAIVWSMERNEQADPSGGNDGGSDVDKKADEFIAKVREQIRLQRIDSIKRSSGHFNTNSTR